FGDRDKAESYNRAAEEIKAGAAKYLYNDQLKRFVRRLIPRDMPTPPAPVEPRATGDQAAQANGPVNGSANGHNHDIYEVDPTIDAALFAIYKFHLFEHDDPRVISTMRAVEQKLWIKTRVGGVARYENDYYHKISNDVGAVPGNPWFICTLWLADYL